MASSKTYTFSRFMEALIEVEEDLSNFYIELAESTRSPQLKEAFSAYGGESGKRSELLGRSRREAIVTRMGGLESTLEIALKPVHGTPIEDHLERIRGITKEPGEALRKALVIERSVTRLYGEAAEGIKRSFPEIASLLRKMAKENLKRIEELEALEEPRRTKDY